MLRRNRSRLRFDERRVMNDGSDVRNVRDRRRLLRGHRCDRDDRRALLERHDRSAGDRFARAFLRRTRCKRKDQRSHDRMQNQG